MRDTGSNWYSRETTYRGFAGFSRVHVGSHHYLCVCVRVRVRERVVCVCVCVCVCLCVHSCIHPRAHTHTFTQSC